MTEQHTTDIADPIELARAAEQAGIAELRAAQDRNAARRAELEALAREAAAEEERLAEHFGKAEAERRHAEQVAAARAVFGTAGDTYAASAETANTLVARVDQLTTEIADAFRDAVHAEVARIAAGNALRDAHRPLAQLDHTIGEPHIPAARLHQRNDMNSPIIGVQHVAVATHPEVETQLQTLAQRRGTGFSAKTPVPQISFGRF